MSNGAKGTPTEFLPKLDAGAGIPVRLMRFTGIQNIPGNGAADNVTAAADGNDRRAHYELSYHPMLRHHRITYRYASDSQPSRTVYVPEACVANWEPA